MVLRHRKMPLPDVHIPRPSIIDFTGYAVNSVTKETRFDWLNCNNRTLRADQRFGWRVPPKMRCLEIRLNGYASTGDPRFYERKVPPRATLGDAVG
jgi:hypothetical protein